MTSTSGSPKQSPQVRPRRSSRTAAPTSRARCELFGRVAEKADVTLVDDPRAADLVVALGGDGTILRTLAAAARQRACR